jgi:hypothetical protein
MIALTYKSQPVTLPPGFRISWELEDNLFDFEVMGEGISWPITIVRDGSEGIFLFAGDVDTADNLFQIYDGFAITVDGSVWWEVSLDLKEADDYYYQGVLTTVNSVFFDNKDKKIGEIITATIAMPNESFAAFKTRWNTPADSVMRFPLINFRDEQVRFEYDVPMVGIVQFSADLANSSEFYLLPVFKWIWIIQQAIEAIGMSMLDEVVDESNDFARRIILYSNRVIDQRGNPNDGNVNFDDIDNLLQVSKHVPDLTLRELIRDYSLYACCRAVITQEGQLKLISIERTIDQPAAVDINIYDPNIPTVKNDIRNIGIDYSVEEIKALPESGYRGAVNDLAAMDALSSPAAGEYVFVREFNRFYQFYELSTVISRRFLSHPFHSFEADKTFNPSVQPVTKDRYTSYKYDSIELVNSSGFVRVNAQTVAAIGDEVNFLNEGENEAEFDPYGKKGVVTSTGAGFFVTDIVYSDAIVPVPKARNRVGFIKKLIRFRIDTATFGITYRNRKAKEARENIPELEYSESASRLIIRKQKATLFAVVDYAVSYPELGQAVTGFKGSVAIWHSMVDGYDSNPYASAWSDPWDQEGNEIGTVSFNTTGPATIFTTIWQRTITFLRLTRLLRISTSESSDKLSTIYDIKKIRGINFSAIFARLRCEITENGIENQEIEAWRN